MRIGVDFGTTRIVVAAVDRGNYPVVTFEAPDGAARDWFPPLVAANGRERRYGFDAWAVAEEPGWTVVRSLKHLLALSGLGTRVDVGGGDVPIVTVLRELARALRVALVERSSLQVRRDEPLGVMLGVPANAHSNQRFLTAEAFRAAGFQVLGLLNEPSAASIELGHRSRIAGEGDLRRAMLVYDFGGGTFDASLVELDEQVHWVRASEGISTLGGDDFDEILAELALDAAGVPEGERDRLSQAQWFALHELCRLHKEALHANAKRMVIDLDDVVEGWPTVTIPVAAFYERCEPLVARTIETVDQLLAHEADARGGGGASFDALFVIGGASELPLVGRRLRERYGRKVRRSAHPRSATAIGLAIQADTEAGYVLRDRFTRYFGVWREGDGGTTAVFDPLFAKGTPLPGEGDAPLAASRIYHPAHNLGHFRYLECSHLAPDGRPSGDLTLWDEIRFPLVPSLTGVTDLSKVEVVHDPTAATQQIEETCQVEAGGSVTVTLSNLTAGYARAYRLGHWGERAEPLRPTRRRRATTQR
ncbi:MAG: Hsp70 family protein [Vicinamibacterales bacterium]|nr:Hsp70 family protein [Vicinamibacterales bacterium]